MKLNNTSYLHKQIRKLCSQLEIISGLKLVTSLDEDIDKISFYNEFGYIILDYKKQACFTLSHKVSEVEWTIARQILISLEWLDFGNKYIEERRRRNNYEQK